MQTETRLARVTDAILAEIDQEAEITQRLFEIIPEDKLNWRPHPKAKSLGELAMHIARLQGAVAELGRKETAQDTDILPDPPPADRAEILEAFAASQQKTREIVRSTSDSELLGEWKLMRGETQLVSMPRITFWRTVLLNHNYHHRGQLSTYLRQLDVPLPSIYGPSADTNPFS